MKMMKRRQNAGENKNDRGFTLVEVIISIAALGLICAVLLRLFVLAGDTSDAAADSQSAHQMAASTLETLVCADTIGDGLDTVFAPLLEDSDDALVDYAAHEGVLYEMNTDSGLLIVDIMREGNDYPGTLYTIGVFIQGDEGKELAYIETKKYERAQTPLCQSYAGAHQ